MNWPALIAGLLTLVAFLAHAIGGGGELAQIAPVDGSRKAAEVRLQVINGWHWVSGDLALSGLLLVAIATTELVPEERIVLLGLSLYFAITGAIWLITTLITSRAQASVVLRLGQWVFCFVVSGLAWLAAQLA